MMMINDWPMQVARCLARTHNLIGDQIGRKPINCITGALIERDKCVATRANDDRWRPSAPEVTLICIPMTRRRRPAIGARARQRRYVQILEQFYSGARASATVASSYKFAPAARAKHKEPQART